MPHSIKHSFSYNAEERLKRQNPINTLSDIGLKPSMTFIDLGCGDGYFTVPAAKIIGQKGKIMAIDINDTSIKTLEEKLKKEKITNYILRVGKAEDVLFEQHSADLIFLGTVLHDFEDPYKVIENARFMLKENGRLINLDWQKKNMSIGPPYSRRFSKEEATKMIEICGLTIQDVRDYTTNYYLIEAIR